MTVDVPIVTLVPDEDQLFGLLELDLIDEISGQYGAEGGRTHSTLNHLALDDFGIEFLATEESSSGNTEQFLFNDKG